MKKKDSEIAVGIALLFLTTVFYFVGRGDWYPVVVGVAIMGCLLPWTLNASKITGKPIHHPINLLAMAVIAAVATMLSSIILERFGLHTIGRRQTEGRSQEASADPSRAITRSIDSEAELLCCGNLSDEEKEQKRRELVGAFNDRRTASDEIREHLPPDDIVSQASAALMSAEELEVANRPEEVDWDDIRLGILENLQGVEQAGVAEMMLEADQFLAYLGREDEAQVRSRAERIWNRTIESHPDFPITGPEAAMFRKIFEMQAALELSDFKRKEEEYQMSKASLMNSLTEQDVLKRLEDWNSYQTSLGESDGDRSRSK